MFLASMFANVSASQQRQPLGGFEQMLIDAVEGEAGVESVKMSVKYGAHFDVQDENGKTALMYAAESNQIEVVKFLHGPNNNSAWDLDLKDDLGKTALMYAAENGNGEIVRYLLRKKANWLLKDINGRDAAHWAEIKGHEAVGKLLRDLGVDVNTKSIGYSNDVALIAAIKVNDFKAVKFFLNHGAFVDMEDGNGKTALMYAAEKGNKKIFDLLLSQGADLMAIVNSVGRFSNYGMANVFIYAALGGNVTILDFLLHRGFDVNYKCSSGFTALHAAAQGGHVDAINFLLDNGAEIDSRIGSYSEGEGVYTPLYCAVILEKIEAVSCLLEHDAEVNVWVNESGDFESLLHIARGLECPEIIELLRAKGAKE
jgi:serine/threonine-protein phosphatase 6 regulatory ankyrin repeat subunit A/serine/threonine-protein phosphatase 6 regulatory ankyrin repeat subunit B